MATLIALVGGLVLFAAAAGRRTASAFPSFVAAHGFDAAVYSNQPLPMLPKLFPAVVSSTELVFLQDTGQPVCACPHQINNSYFEVVIAGHNGPTPFKLLSGHLPDPSAPDQVLASFTLQKDDGVHLGSVIRVPFYATSQASAYNNVSGPSPEPEGPTLAFHVVGLEASEGEFPAGSGPTYDLWGTQTLARSLVPRTPPSYTYYVRLRRGAADINRFYQEAKAAKSVPGYNGASSLDAVAASIDVLVHPQAVGWWALAALAALVGLAVVGQALFRQSNVEREDFPTMAAIGADRRLLVSLGLTRALTVGLIGAAGAVALATALSGLAPLGEARTAEVSTGVHFDVLVLPLGALITALAVLALGVWPAVRASHNLWSGDLDSNARPSVTVARLAAAGAPPSAVIGVSHVLGSRSGGAPIPVRSAVLGTVLAVIALCGTAVFGASLSHLTATPRLYGDDFQLDFPINEGSRGWVPVLLKRLVQDKRVSAITEGIAGFVPIDNVPTGVIVGTAVRGQLLFSTVSGQLPTGAGQIDLGATIMRQIGAHVGSVIDFPGRSGAVPMRVVGEVSLPVVAAESISLGNGALLSAAGFLAAQCPRGPLHTYCLQKENEGLSTGGGALMVSVVPGPLGRQDVNRYLNNYQSIATPPSTPTSLVNFGEAVDFPLIFGTILAAFGAATLVHLLVVSVARRRREIGLLKVLGFVNSQVGSVVAWQATTLAGIGIIVGTPLGVVIGRVVWRAFANNLGAVPVSVVPVWFLVGLLASVVIVANLIAIGPALVATRQSRRSSCVRSKRPLRFADADELVHHRVECPDPDRKMAFSLFEMDRCAREVCREPLAVRKRHHEVGRTLPDREGTETSLSSKPQLRVNARSSSTHPSTPALRASWKLATMSSPNSSVITARSTSGSTVRSEEVSASTVGSFR